MTKLNPFRFGDPVAGEFYLARDELSATVSNFLENHIHIVLIGPRRFGKTSFVNHLLQKMEDKQRSCLFVDIYNITSHKDFLYQLHRSLKEKSNWKIKIKEKVKTLKYLRPILNSEIDNDGKSSFSLSAEFSKNDDVKELIQDFFTDLSKLNVRVILAIDEFQKVADIEDKGWLEATLRTQMQKLKNVTFLFTGSRQSVISDMINNQSRPFFRSCQPIEFPLFGDEFTNWIIKKFQKIDIKTNPESINYLRKLLQDTPNYVQMACYHLVAQGVSKVDQQQIDKVLNTIVSQNSYAYQTVLNSLTLPQQRALRLCANESEAIYNKEFLQKYEMASAPALASAIKALKEKKLLDESSIKGRVVFDDPLFALWLKLEFR
jgi:AAA+ ATPase superfamily predicted ATPase